jgi:aspartate/methionine/tyrosine aminotransferase
MTKFDLGWGESVAVRKAFVEASGNFFIPFNNKDIVEMGYTPHEGDPAMIEATRKVIERQTGIRYDYIVLTHGATGGLHVALNALKQQVRYESVVTAPAPFFRMYPSIIKSAGFEHEEEVNFSKIDRSAVILVDSPSNPIGNLWTGDLGMVRTDNKMVVWDSVYHTGSYLPKIHLPPPNHVLNVGSFSKMTGINGIRVGWVATNNGSLYERLKECVATEYCGLSSAQNRIILDLVKHCDWDAFEQGARRKLDGNREEWSKLEKYFGDTTVYPIGMFYYSRADQSCKDLLDRAGITYFPGSKLYHNDDFIRINLGQDVELVRDAVKAILAEDKI